MAIQKKRLTDKEQAEPQAVQLTTSELVKLVKAKTIVFALTVAADAVGRVELSTLLDGAKQAYNATLASVLMAHGITPDPKTEYTADNSTGVLRREE